ncbi:MAG: hypothetical protein OEW67_09190 [Cyclobacteriaceae bacterium]|nr:hypothetical protein [Cyclobacteriaceae bacterium]
MGKIRSSLNITSFSVLLIICGVLCIIIFSIDIMLPRGIAGGVPYVIVVLISIRLKNSKAILYITIICTLLTIGGYYFSPVEGKLWKVIINRLLAVLVIWSSAFLSIKIDDAHKEIKVLEGLLPICATCKKIKDEKGNWSQIEHYVNDHSDVQFSHGMCPSCLNKLYPDQDHENISKSNN